MIDFVVFIMLLFQLIKCFRAGGNEPQLQWCMATTYHKRIPQSLTIAHTV